MTRVASEAEIGVPTYKGRLDDRIIPQLRRYGVALLSFALALGATLFLAPLLKGTNTPLFFMAVMVSAWYGGIGPGLLVTILSVLAINYFLIPPLYSLTLTDLETVIRLGVFIMAAVLISWLNETRRIAQRRAEISLRSLQESEACFGRLFETSIIGVTVADLNGSIMQANDAFLQTVGYTREELRAGRVRWREMTPPEYLAVSERSVEQLKAIGTCTPFEKEYIRKDGSRAPVLLGSALSQAETIIGFVLDLSERKQLDETLKQREAELRLITNALPVLISFVDAEQRYRFNNQTYEEWFGHPAASIYGKQVQEVLGLPAYTLIRPYIEQVLNGERVTFESQVPYQTAGTRYIEATYVPRFNAQGQVEGYAALICDVSDRKRIEAERQRSIDALHESETRFRHMADTAPVLIWMSGTDKRSNYFNQVWLDFTGRTIAQELGDSWAEGIHPDDIQPYLDVYTTAFDARQPFQMEYRLKRFDGAYRWLFGTGVPRFTPEGAFVGYIGSSVDINVRKHAEHALQIANERFEMATAAVNCLIYDWQIQQNTVTRTEGLTRVFGYTLAEAEPTSTWWQEHIHPDDWQHVQEQAALAWATGDRYQLEYRVRKQDNQYIHVLDQGIVVQRDADDKPIRQIGSITDNSDRKQAEQALQKESERLRLLSKTTSALLFTEQPLTLMDSLFRELSAQMDLHFYFNFLLDQHENQPMLRLESYGGISDEAAQAIHWLKFEQGMCGLVAKECRQIVIGDVQQSTHPNAQIIRSLGITAYAGQPLIVQGQLLGTLSFASLTRTHFTSEEIALMQTTSEQIAVAMERAKLMTSLRQQAEHLMQANRIKDEFLAVLSHELRSPLNPILGWSKLLRERTFDEATTRRGLETIERNARLQTQLIEDLLDISKILQGKLSLKMQPVRLISTVEAAMETVQLAAEAKTIQMQRSLDIAVGQVLGDSSRLQQVIWNLVSNAVKFTPVGGRVDVQLTTVGTDAAIIVRDTGKGINPDFLPYVFDHFRQADSATTRNFGGLGLGLAIAHQLVELHGGTIHADSAGENQGATFTVKLPLLRELKGARKNTATHASAFPHSSSLPLNGWQILIVDDEADARDFLTVLLEQSGAAVTAVASADEALQAMNQATPDLLISDIGMSEVDGYMLIRAIRALPPEQGGQVPAIALTAYASEADSQRALLAGFQKHLSKPLEPTQLVAAITTLDSNQAVSRKATADW